LDGRTKEAEGFGVASKGKGKAGAIVNRCRSRKAFLKYIVCCCARLWPNLHDLLVCLIDLVFLSRLLAMRASKRAFSCQAHFCYSCNTNRKYSPNVSFRRHLPDGTSLVAMCPPALATLAPIPACRLPCPASSFMYFINRTRSFSIRLILFHFRSCSCSIT